MRIEIILSMRQVVASSFCVLFFFFSPKLSVQQEKDLFSAPPLSSNDFYLENADVTSSLPWEDFPNSAASYVDNAAPEIGLDLKGEAASPFLSPFLVADSNLDMLQSSCDDSMTTGGKLRARNDQPFCRNREAPPPPLQLQPNLFDNPLLPGLSEEEDATPAHVILFDDGPKKCKEDPFIINLCCHGPPSGYFSMPQIWDIIKGCSLCKIFFMFHHA